MIILFYEFKLSFENYQFYVAINFVNNSNFYFYNFFNGEQKQTIVDSYFNHYFNYIL